MELWREERAKNEHKEHKPGSIVKKFNVGELETEMRSAANIS